MSLFRDTYSSSICPCFETLVLHRYVLVSRHLFFIAMSLLRDTSSSPLCPWFETLIFHHFVLVSRHSFFSAMSLFRDTYSSSLCPCCRITETGRTACTQPTRSAARQRQRSRPLWWAPAPGPNRLRTTSRLFSTPLVSICIWCRLQILDFPTYKTCNTREVNERWRGFCDGSMWKGCGRPCHG